MKNVTFISTLVVCTFVVMDSLVAQPTISILPKVGDISMGEYGHVAGVQPGTIGQNQNWDYQNILDSAMEASTKFVNPETTPYFSFFPQADLAAVINDTMYSYYQVGTDDLSILGGKSANESFVYSHPYITYAIPYSYGDSFHDSATLYFMVQSQKDTTKVLDTTLVTGYGTLKLPEKVYANVVQLRHINTVIARLYFPGFGEMVLPPSSDTSYTYFKNGMASPLLFYSILNGDIQLLEYYKAEALPLHFIAFSAESLPSGVELDWQTGEEVNTKNFIIQRSTDGLHFVNIGEVEAGGKFRYRFTDPASGILNEPDMINRGQTDYKLFYRLMQTDKDGRFNFSSIIACQLKFDKLPTLFPSPAHNFLKLAGVQIYDRLNIYDVAGRRLLENHFNAEQITIPVASLPAGVYIVELIGQKGALDKRLRFIKK